MVKDKIAILFQLSAISQWTYQQFSQFILVMEKKDIWLKIIKASICLIVKIVILLDLLVEPMVL